MGSGVSKRGSIITDGGVIVRPLARRLLVVASRSSVSVVEIDLVQGPQENVENAGCIAASHWAAQCLPTPSATFDTVYSVLYLSVSLLRRQ